MNLTIQQAAKACNGKLYKAEGADNIQLQGAVLDSRLVKPGYLFFATKGERVDGHAFIPTAVEKGAVCVVCEKLPEGIAADGIGGVSYILVKDSFQALKDIAESYRRSLDITVVGITGSVGKTSTKEFIAGVLSEQYCVLKTEGNFNNEVGLPLTILKIREEHEVAVVEMGISEFGEMHRLSKIARPNICVMTNIGQCHLENLHSREGILKAKSEIFDFMNEFGYVVLNGDDDMLATLTQIHGRTPVRFGVCEDKECAEDVSKAGKPKRTVYATDIVNKGLFGSEAVLHLEGNTYPMKVSLPGRHMVYNALAATCVARLLDMDITKIQQGLEKLQPVGGRSNIIRTEKYTIIDDCYNANPVSMKAAIDLLTSAEGRTVAILGDMFELGVRENALHEGVGSYAVEHDVDVLLCVGKLSCYMYDGAMRVWNEAGDVRYFETKEELLEALPGILNEGDTILVKASHGMHFEEVVQKLEK